MIAYHLDRDHVLHENSFLTLQKTNAFTNCDSIQLYGLNSVSHWGLAVYNYLNSQGQNYDLSTVINIQIELNAEIIRQNFFPKRPSRFKSLFAVKHLEDFRLWEKLLPINPNSAIYEVSYNPTHCAELDASFLKGNIGSDPLQQAKDLIKYWEGTRSSNPLIELVIPLPVKILRCVRE